MAYLGESIPKLGFGYMRLPRKEQGGYDMKMICDMVDYFMDNGFTYFDTAYVYDGGESEKAIYESLVSRYPRERFQLATKLKLPMAGIETADDVGMELEKSLERTGAGYFDFYLLHALSGAGIEEYERLGAWDFVKRMKEEGKIRHYGFSFHDTADKLEALLQKHPDAEFVQLQINYADWEDPDVQARKNYEVCRKYGKPVVIMEPVKGGNLVTFKDEIKDMLRAYNPDASAASWALRFCASLEGLVTILSGMSSFEQLKDNVDMMKNFRPLCEEEYALLQKVREKLAETDTIPCTGCRYCTEVCPMNIDIPRIFEVANGYKMYDNIIGSKRTYGFIPSGRTAASCIECGACEETCPQHLPIRELLKEANANFGG